MASSKPPRRRKLTVKQAEARLDEIAQLINELHVLARASFDPKAYIYFESEGSAHLMRAEGPNDAEATCSERQSKIIASSKFCCFDCGAW